MLLWCFASGLLLLSRVLYMRSIVMMRMKKQ